MRIGISLLACKRHRTGTDNVSFNLVRHLAKVDRKNEYVIFVNAENRSWFPVLPDRWKVVYVKLTAHRVCWVWEHLFFHFDPRAKGLDLVHFPNVAGVVGYRGKFVVTIHDLKHYLRPDPVRFRRYLLHSVLYKTNVPKASMIITISHYVKNQIVRHFSVPPEKVRVIYNGIDTRFKPMPKSDIFKASYSLPQKYLLYVGTTDKNKNLRRMIEAFSRVRNKNRLNHHLVIAGSQGSEHNNLRAYVKYLGLEDIVHFTGYFPDEALPDLYSNASVFLFASLDEGFGIPPLEAMACGTPVVASNTTASPEVLGESAILVDPVSVASITIGIESLLLDSSLREKYEKQGLAKARLFSWEQMAQMVVKVYDAAVAS